MDQPTCMEHAFILVTDDIKPRKETKIHNHTAVLPQTGIAEKKIPYPLHNYNENKIYRFGVHQGLNSSTHLSELLTYLLVIISA